VGRSPHHIPAGTQNPSTGVGKDNGVSSGISKLKQQGLIEHTGSKKSGGYKAVNTSRENNEPPTNSQ
jgi:hypothetical protein